MVLKNARTGSRVRAFYDAGELDRETYAVERMGKGAKGQSRSPEEIT